MEGLGVPVKNIQLHKHLLHYAVTTHDTSRFRPGIVALALVVCATRALYAQPPAPSSGSGDSAELAKKLSNPISDLVSVPFQFNWEQNVGPKDQTRFILNVQPVMPFTLTPRMNLITRVIVPFVSQPPLADGGAPAAGVGDVLASFSFHRTPGAVSPGGSARSSASHPRQSRRLELRNGAPVRPSSP
jgi:hypothetical protein